MKYFIKGQGQEYQKLLEDRQLAPRPLMGEDLNKAPRRKQWDINCALQPAFAPRGEELNPEEIKESGKLIYSLGR